jgi:6-pyruvoyltetrahydropterin/6-carboxytetrahydropterin synthase
MPRILTTAAGAFESARRIDALDHSHRCRRTHGHGFRACVHAALSTGCSTFPGGEIAALRERMTQALAPLDYRDLNTIIEAPTDENIARWVHARLAMDDIERLAVQSTADQGVDLDRLGMAHVWRRYRFQAAHRLPNVPPGHKCGRMHGHGFEVIVHANQDLGSRPLSIDYDRLDALWAPLHAQLDHRCLNEIAGLSNPTSEIIASWLWTGLKPVLPELSWVTVYETASCGANFDGERYRIWKDFTLDSAVRLARAPEGSPLERIHGHTFTLRLHLGAPLDAVLGWTLDFGDVKALFDPLFKMLDHQPLHELPGLRDADTQSLSEWIFHAAAERLPQLVRCDLYETQGCGSIVTQDIEVPALPL